MIRRILLLIILSLMILGCKNKDQNPVPKVGVNIWLTDINQDPEYSKLLAPYNAIICNGGYLQNGIIVYRVKIEEAVDDFVAYDRTCTNEANSCVMIWTQKDNYYCTCKCCNSKFNLTGGYLEKGPAKFPLRKYSCEYIDGTIHIY